jgi:hypothetical protein
MKIPEIGEDGQGQLSQRFDIRKCDSSEILTGSPDYLLLSFNQKKTSDKFTRVWAAALLYLFVACFFCLFVIWLPRPLALGLSLLILIVILLKATWTEYRKPGDIWKNTQWIDFKTRTLHERMDYPDQSLPTNIQSISLNQLILVCFRDCNQDHEDRMEIFYRVGLCKDLELKNLRTGCDMNLLCDLQHTDTEDAAISFTKQLAQQWNLSAWRGFRPGISLNIQKLHTSTPDILH